MQDVLIFVSECLYLHIYFLIFQTIYRWKENLTAKRIHFKYLKNILIAKWFRNGSGTDV